MEDGRILSFGSNEYGELGIGYTIDSIGPIPTKLVPDMKYVKILCGSHFTLCCSVANADLESKMERRNSVVSGKTKSPKKKREGGGRRNTKRPKKGSRSSTRTMSVVLPL